MTAVEWLVNMLEMQGTITPLDIKEAKKIETRQILNAWLTTKPTTFGNWKNEFEQYYNETYKNTNK
jgi:hypothetical protein